MDWRATPKVLPNLAFGLAALFAIVAPDATPAWAAVNVSRAFIVEGVVIHASLLLPVPASFVSSALGRVGAVAAVLAVYALLILGFTLATGASWALPLFALLIAGRAIAVVAGERFENEAGAKRTFVAWFGSLLLWVLVVVALAWSATSEGVTYLDVARVGAFVYFTMAALSELTAWGWFRRWQAKAARWRAQPQRTWRQQIAGWFTRRRGAAGKRGVR